MNAPSPPPSHPGKGIFVDIEAVPGGDIFAIGAIFGNSFRHEAVGAKGVTKLVREIRAIAGKADFVAGHNIVLHDLPLLDAAYGIPELKALPVIDTLFVSPLAFPRNPYHRLIKNDRLTRSSKSHPVRDCDSSQAVLGDAIGVFSSAVATPPAATPLALIRWLLLKARLPWNASLGFDLLFESLRVPALSSSESHERWMQLTAGVTCPKAAAKEWARLDQEHEHAAALAYVLAWLGVAGSDSVMPGWVRRQFPRTLPTVHRLRQTPCGDAHCPWCSEVQDPTKQLKRFFGYDDYRTEPALPGTPGVSLQREIVRQGMAGESVLAILPTGGGKSLCFQVPALYRYFTSGALTVVITPLQALMKDQVDGLVEKSSVTCAATLNGLQTPPEKAEVREAVRLGGVGILYVSPEQLRNSSFRKTIIQREIGCWVFDEAHCLSQWGHDFRPDYVYIARFIKELADDQGVPVPQVMCVTATAKDEVKNEIITHFRNTLNLSLVLLDGGTNRENLSYQIEEVREPEKSLRVHDLLSSRIGNGLGAAVVFAATRNRVADLALFLAAPPRNWACAAFHAGLESEQKKAVLDDFLAGRLQVVVATNAFGMGIDKANIRLVIHSDTPGSLENYLQEAGRAGRDREPAECVLLYNPEDLETQFGLHALSKIEKREIDHIWRSIRRVDRGEGKPITVTVSELLDGGMVPSNLSDEEDAQRGTKVRTALAVLEKQGFLQRDENANRVFQARPLVASEDEAQTRIARLDLPQWKAGLWLEVIHLLLEDAEGKSLRLDDFAELRGMRTMYEQMRARRYEQISQYTPVFAVLNEMARPEVGLISKDVLFSARLRVGRGGQASQDLQALARRERGLLETLRDLEPDPEGWTALNLRRLNQKLLDDGHTCLPHELVDTFRRLESDGRKFGKATPLIQLAFHRKDFHQLKLNASWTEVIELTRLRNAAAAVIVSLLLRKAKEQPASAGTDALVEFGETEIVNALRGDLEVSPHVGSIHDLTGLIQYLLVYLHDTSVIELRNGKALIAQSMTLRVLEKTSGKQWRRFTKGDYSTLLVHYSEKVFQIHVMGEYARAGIERLGQHLRLIRAYFEMGKEAFAARFLRENREVYQRATGIDSYRKIVDSLQNPIQQAIVAEAPETNMLVLAGPGSGKTRVVAHRCGYLLRVHRIKPERILVACFNRHAALQLKRQIYRLVGKAAYGVTIQTYHGLALRLLGRSFLGGNQDEMPDFSTLLEDATVLLTSKNVSMDTEEMRDRILAGFSHILVDEYQDVDEREYAFISAIAGRHEADDDRKLAIMAVGDDDQSIYGFKGANVAFIRRFQQDYTADEHYLTENYRSTHAIIATANQLIAQNTDRMKVAQPIRVNHKRRDDPEGGAWTEIDPLTQGNVQRVSVRNEKQQAAFIAQEIMRMSTLSPEVRLSDFAVLSRTRSELIMIRAGLEELNLPVDWRAEDEVVASPFKIREVDRWLTHLGEHRHETWDAKRAKGELAKLQGKAPSHRWWQFLQEIWSEWASEAGEAEAPVSLIRDFFGEAIAERKRHDRTGNGVVLTTAHKAKGLEFGHVVVADGGWRQQGDKASREEERRVFYVAMTRAKETLCVLVRRDRRNPFAAEISGQYVIDRSPREEGPLAKDGAWSARRYAALHPSEMFLSYAGNHAADDPVPVALAEAEVGAPLRFHPQGNQVFLLAESGTAIAALSAAGREKWMPRIPYVQQSRIIGIIRRRATAGDSDPSRTPKADQWEIPVVEVCWSETEIAAMEIRE